jgi:hypothetical protein
VLLPQIWRNSAFDPELVVRYILCSNLPKSFFRDSPYAICPYGPAAASRDAHFALPWLRCDGGSQSNTLADFKTGNPASLLVKTKICFASPRSAREISSYAQIT